MPPSAEARRDLEREAAALAAHRHPCILQLYGVAHLEGGPAGKVALVTQLAECGSLEGLIHKGGHEALINSRDNGAGGVGGTDGGGSAAAAALLLPAGWRTLPLDLLSNETSGVGRSISAGPQTRTSQTSTP